MSTSNRLPIAISFSDRNSLFRSATLLALGAAMIFSQDRFDRWEILYRGSNPTPDYQVIQFSDPMTGFISHIDGMLKSSDGGATWNAMGAAAGPFPSTFGFADRTTGYGISGDRIFKTSDGGATWAVLDAPPTGWISIAILNRDTVYVSGGSWGFPDKYGTVLRTHDGGAHWSTVLETEEPIYGVHFISGRLGFAWQLGELFRTGNGGADWSLVSLQETVIGCVSFRDAKSGFLAGRDSLWASNDSGKTWSLAHPAFPGNKGMKFLTSQIGFAHGVGGVYTTRNGGNTWSKVILGPAYISSLTFIDSLKGWAVGGAVIQKTVDGGRTWSFEREILSDGQVMSAISFSDGHNGHIAGGGLLINTTDGGLHWSNHASAKPIPDAGILGIQFSDALAGFMYANKAYVGTEILRTRDGGITWDSLAMLSRGLVSASFADSRTRYGVASSPGPCSGIPGQFVCEPPTGYILKSNDSGRTWSETVLPGGDPSFIQCFGPDTCMVLGIGGKFWKTQNGGADGWKAFHSTGLPVDGNPIQLFVRDMHFPTSQVGYATSNIGLFKTTNGGADWALAGARMGYMDALSIRFIDSRIGYAVGSGGAAKRTADGGLTWASETTGTENHLTNLSCPVPDTCFAIGVAGVILRLVRGDLGVGVRKSEKTPALSRIRGRWQYFLSRPTAVRAIVYDLDGKRLGALVEGIQQPGVHVLPEPSGHRFGRGARILDFRAGETRATLRFVAAH